MIFLILGKQHYANIFPNIIHWDFYNIFCVVNLIDLFVYKIIEKVVMTESCLT